MTSANFPQVGDLAVDLRTNGRPGGVPMRIGATVTVKAILTTIVLTSDGERYNRGSLKPVSEGRYSDRTLVPAGDDRVLIVKGREHLETLAGTVTNLAKLDHRKPEDIVQALAQIIVAAGLSRRAVIELMAGASRTEQESPR
jgi:hypothetical protein